MKKTFKDYLEDAVKNVIPLNESKETEKMYDFVDDNKKRILSIIKAESGVDQNEINSLENKMEEFINNFSELDEDGIKYSFTRILNDIDYFKIAYNIKNLKGIIQDMIKIKGPSIFS